MIDLENGVVRQIIADIIGNDCEWKPNGGVCEGYRIIVGVDDLCLPSFYVDRLRIRINTVERILNNKHIDGSALRYWRFVYLNDKCWELRLYDGICSSYKDFACVKSVRLFEEVTAGHRDGYMSLAEYMLMRAYTGRRGNDQTGRLLSDFASDKVLQDEYYAESGELYEYIGFLAADGYLEALDKLVDDYRRYCQGNNLEYDAFMTYAEMEAECDEEDEESFTKD